MDSIPADSLHERVYQKIKSDILLGLYHPGEKLDVNGLAGQYGVSRTPVRDALHVLQREGLVEVLPRVGYFTSRITIKDIEDVFQLRLIVETASAELAAARISVEGLAYLERLGSRYVAGDVQSYREFLAENREFHHRVALASGNRLLAQVVDGLLNQMQRMLVLRLDLRDNADEMLAEHGRLLSALRARDSAGARELMADALRNAQEAVMQSILTKGKDWAL
jgi:GntR family transcriptional regulator, rspAB operon transcriptional repressor